MAEQPADPLLTGRNETPLQRCDRNLVELMQEVRVVQTGVQVLFAFLLMAPLSARFPDLSTALQVEYFVTMLSTGAAAILLMAPTAYHRILFRRGDKEYLVAVANRFTLVGLVCVGVAMLGALVFVAALLFPGAVAIATAAIAAAGMSWCWCVGPLRRRQVIDRDGSGERGDPGRLVPLR
jgi:hypothetical protein